MSAIQEVEFYWTCGLNAHVSNPRVSAFSQELSSFVFSLAPELER